VFVVRLSVDEMSSPECGNCDVVVGDAVADVTGSTIIGLSTNNTQFQEQITACSLTN